MTIKEIAKQAGVGVSTVSRYLNDGYVSEEKRETIGKVIEENNYTRNDAALSMRGISTEVAIIIQRISSVTASYFLDGAVSKCLELGLQPKIFTVKFDEELQQKYITEVIRKKYRAIIVFSYKKNFDFKFKNLFVIGQKSDINTCVYIDNQKIYTELTKYVVENNNVSKVYILGVELIDEALINRMQGAKQVCIENNIDYQLIDFGFEKNNVDIPMEKYAYYSCMTDSQAYRIIEEAQKLNWKLGHDYYVSGFGNYYSSSILGLTSVDVEYEEMGKLVIEKVANYDYNNTIFDYSLVYRKSTNE